jgi:glycosyltransferase involved in cell wall biosynthesis
MKVLFCYITAESVWSPSIETEMETIAREFPQDTYYVLCLESTEFGSSSRPDNIKAISISPRSHREWTRYRLYRGVVARLAKYLQVDLIWSVNIGLYHRSEIPQVVSVRNAFEVYPRQVARFYEHGTLHLAIMRHCFRKSLRHCDGVIVQTPLIATHVRQIQSAPERIAVIPKTVESLENAPVQPLADSVVRELDGGLGRGAFTFIYVASPTLHKNHAVLIKAMEILRRQEVKVRIALTVSTSQVFAMAGESARSLVETGHLLPMGRVGKGHLRSLYDACNGCVMPSLLESLSSSYLETMHWGKPQISADLPFAHEACGDAALYARPADTADWAAKMRVLAEGRALRDELVEAGHRQMERYPKMWAEAASRLHRFLQEVIDSTGRR